MRRQATVLLLCLLIGFAWNVPLDAESPTAAQAKWAFMVYMAADNNLEGAAIDDLNELETVGSTAEVHIVVQVDRNPYYDSSNGNWTTTRRYYVERDSNPYLISSALLADLDELNMGNPQTLVDFVTWAKDRYPAENYALVLWDHGSGWRIRDLEEEEAFKAVCYDDTDGYDRLDMPELRAALQGITAGGAAPLALIGFDACLMAASEVDEQCRPYAQVRVGSQETEPFDGWPYDTILNSLVGNPAMSAAELASIIVDHYIAFYGNYTQSAVDLGTPYDALRSALDIFAQVLSDVAPAYCAEINAARNAAFPYSYGLDIDIYDLAKEIKQRVGDPAVQAAAQAVLDAIGAVMLNEKHGSAYADTHGLSIYFPRYSYNYDNRYDGERDFLRFTVETRWDEWLRNFYVCSSPPTPPDQYEPDDNCPSNNEMPTDGTVQTHNFHNAGDWDWARFRGIAGTQYKIKTLNLGLQCDTRLRLYDADGVALLAADEDVGDREGSYLEWTALADGTYHLLVQNQPTYSYGPPTSYDLQIIGLPPLPPLVGPLTPDAGTSQPGALVTFTSVYTDDNGFEDIAMAYFILGSPDVPSAGVSLRYDQQNDRLYLQDSAGEWQPRAGVKPGRSIVIENERAKVEVARCRVVRTGNRLGVTWAFRAKGILSPGIYTLYHRVSDRTGLVEGWKPVGTWTVDWQPRTLSISPRDERSFVRTYQVFTTKYRDKDGESDLQDLYLAVTPGEPEAGGGLILRYNTGLGRFYLWQEGWQPAEGFYPGEDRSVENDVGVSSGTRCSVVRLDRTRLRIKWGIQFKEGAEGRYRLYMRAVDKQGVDSGWVRKGSWNVQPWVKWPTAATEEGR